MSKLFEQCKIVLLFALTAVVIGLVVRSPVSAPHKFGAVNVPSSQTVAAWFVDNANVSTTASDSNDCQTSSTACLTFGQIVSRWGTKFPTFAQVTTITWLSDDVATDPYDVVPTIIGGGGLLLKGTLISVATATIGTFTAKNRAAGTKATITASGQSGTYWSTACGGTCVGMDVHDTTSNVQFWIDADNGSATAAITEPFTSPVGEGPVRATPVNGDSLTLYRPTVVYFTRFDSVALGTGVGGGVLAEQLAMNADFEIYIGAQVGLVEVLQKAPQILFSLTAPTTAIVTSCFALSGKTLSGSTTIWGGSMFNQQGSQLFNRSQLDYDAIVNLRPHSEGVVGVFDAYFGQWFTDTAGTQKFVRYTVSSSNGGVAAVWGPATIAIDGGEQLLVTLGATATASLLATGGLLLDGAATGFTFNTSTGAFSAGATSLTPANLDTNGSYQNPRTGTRFYVSP